MSSIYYLINKESETGKKITELKERIDEAKAIRKSVLDIIGVTVGEEIEQYRGPVSDIIGIPTGIYFSRNPDPRVWKSVKNGCYFPKHKTGVHFLTMLGTIPTISRHEFDVIIGNDHSPIHQVGVCLYGKKYGFSVDSNWNFKPNEDMIEVTGSEYKNNNAD